MLLHTLVAAASAAGSCQPAVGGVHLRAVTRAYQQAAAAVALSLCCHRSIVTTTPAPWWAEPWPLPAGVRGWLKACQRGANAFPASGPLTAGSMSPARHVPASIPRPVYAQHANRNSKGPGLGKSIEVQGDEASRAAMRAACKLAARALQLAGSLAAPGVTTDAIDAAVHDFLVQHGAYPSPLGYHGFPKSVCTSVNEVVCHGIPDSRPLREGDLLNVDVTAYLGGFHGDTNATFLIGEVSEAAAALVDTTRRCLDAAIAVCGPGVSFRAIGATIQGMASAEGLTVIRGFVGHGIGREFHAAPAVLHHRNMHLHTMQLWQTFTIEPILSLGRRQDCAWPQDASGWSRVTADGALSAQFEHTLMVTEAGAEVLTRVDDR